MQRDRACAPEQVTTLICIACVTLGLACSADSELTELTNSQGFSLVTPSADLRLQFEGDSSTLVARRELALEFRVLEGVAAAPDSLELLADMPSMSHGPRRAVLHRSGNRYRGEILFVMGGDWVVDFRSASASLGLTRCYVHER